MKKNKGESGTTATLHLEFKSRALTYALASEIPTAQAMGPCRLVAW